jgi:DNA-directed RNA polymerase subunit RPC12/RpoP
MSFHYKCHFCSSIFKSENAVDGFKDGFTEGFLCPDCGKNIDEHEYPEEFSIKSISIIEWASFFMVGVMAYCLAFLDKPITEMAILFSIFCILILINNLKRAGKKRKVILLTVPVQENETSA